MFLNRLPTVYQNRASQKAIWEKDYAEQIEVVEWLLRAVCEAFDFPPNSRYQFSPVDQLQEIYCSRYPRWKFWRLGDSLELGNLVLELETRLGACDPELSTLTLGEIVTRADAKKGSMR